MNICPICLDDIEPGNGVAMYDCPHEYCMPCGKNCDGNVCTKCPQCRSNLQGLAEGEFLIYVNSWIREFDRTAKLGPSAYYIDTSKDTSNHLHCVVSTVGWFGRKSPVMTFVCTLGPRGVSLFVRFEQTGAIVPY